MSRAFLERVLDCKSQPIVGLILKGRPRIDELMFAS